MKITIESTTKVVEVVNDGFGKSAAIQARVWEGETDSGIKVQCLITRIAAEATQNLSQFERELQECKAPSVDVQMFPMRMIL
jgi:hypothetical protein